MFIDFRDLRQRVTIEQVLAWKGWTGSAKADQLKGRCLVCNDDSERCFVVTPRKGLWHCFACKRGGDIIELIANIEDTTTKRAAELIAEHFLTERVTYRPDDELKPLDYLKSDHELVTELGLPKQVCDAIGAGYAPKGTMSGRLCIPLRTEDGTLLGYVGISPRLDPIIKLPGKWRL